MKRRYVLWQNTTRASPLVVLLARVESTIPYPRYRRFENYLAERFPPPLLPQLFTRRSVARGGLLASNFSSHSAGFASFSLSSRERAPTPRYVSSTSSFSSACEDKRTSSKTDRPLAQHDTPRVIKRREETRELLCITRDAREP